MNKNIFSFVVIIVLFLACVNNSYSAPRKNFKKKAKVEIKQDIELFTMYKTLDLNKESYKIYFNEKNYIQYDDVDFNLMFNGKNYSWVIGNIEQFVVDTENACIKASNTYNELKLRNYDFSNVQQTTKTDKGFYSRNIIDRPLYQFNYVIDNNVHYLQLLVRENEWSEYHYVFSKDIEKHINQVSKAFCTSYNQYLLLSNLKQNAIKVTNKEMNKIFKP